MPGDNPEWFHVLYAIMELRDRGLSRHREPGIRFDFVHGFAISIFENCIEMIRVREREFHLM